MGERTDRIMALADIFSERTSDNDEGMCEKSEVESSELDLRAAVQELEDEIERLKGLLERALAAGEGCAVNAAEALRLFNAAIAGEGK